MKGWDGLVLSVNVPYPASLVVDGSRKMGLVFRLLWLSKVSVHSALFRFSPSLPSLTSPPSLPARMIWQRCARQTRSLWLDLQQLKGLGVGAAMKLTRVAMQRMLEFANNWEYYLTREVVEPQWRAMEAGMREARGVGDMRDRWGEFLDGVLKECLLTNRELLRSLLGVVRTCLLFSGTVDSLFSATKLKER